jgi:Na+/proline symporter
MSTLTAGILYFGGILVNNIYQEHFVRNASAKHYLRMSRVLSAAGLIVAWGVTGMIDSIVQFTKYVEPLNGLTGISLLIALMWRRITGYGAIAGLAVMCPLFYFTAATPYASVDQMNIVLRSVVESMQAFYTWTGASVPVIDNNKLDVPYMYPIFLIPGLLVTIGVSLITPQHNDRAVAEFYARLDTPVGQEYRIREMGFEADTLEHLDREKIDATPTSTNTQRLLLVDWLHLPAMLWRGEARLWEYKWDLIGLVGSIVFIVAFLWFVNWLGSFF